jgi:hypothetical protein
VTFPLRRSLRFLALPCLAFHPLASLPSHPTSSSSPIDLPPCSTPLTHLALPRHVPNFHPPPNLDLSHLLPPQFRLPPSARLAAFRSPYPWRTGHPPAVPVADQTVAPSWIGEHLVCRKNGPCTASLESSQLDSTLLSCYDPPIHRQRCASTYNRVGHQSKQQRPPHPTLRHNPSLPVTSASPAQRPA